MAARVAVSASTASATAPIITATSTSADSPRAAKVPAACVPGPSRPLGRSGERRRGCASSGTRHGSVALRTALTEAAHTATRTNNTYLAAHHAHIRNRRGLPNAIGATRHDLLIADWHLMHDQVDYGDLARTAPSAATPPGAALAG